jgi:hypothetical protein
MCDMCDDCCPWLPSHPPSKAVENMRNGMNATAACTSALGRVGAFYPTFQGALVSSGCTPCSQHEPVDVARPCWLWQHH